MIIQCAVIAGSQEPSPCCFRKWNIRFFYISYFVLKQRNIVDKKFKAFEFRLICGTGFFKLLLSS